MVTVLESCSLGRHPGRPNEDRIVVGRRLVGVVDGATAKSWTGRQALTGGEVADVVAGVLAAADGEDLPELLDAMNTHLPPHSRGSAATFAVYDPDRHEVWRIGEQWLVMDGVVLAAPPSPEATIAAVRQMVLRARLATGADVDDLLARDPGRIAILPLIRASEALRNTEPDGFAVVDGTRVPPTLQERIRLSRNTREIVLATDGYPVPAASLELAEAALDSRLRQDPLMMMTPPATKGVTTGATSYDDRTYIRIRV